MKTTTINSIRGRSARFVSWLVVLSVLLGTLPAFGHQSLKSADLVFCPLQKAWVERYAPPAKVENSLEDICASDRQKERFIAEMSKQISLSRSIANFSNQETLFFNYLEKGKQAFSVEPSSQNSPEREIARLASTPKSATQNHPTGFDKNQTEIFAFASHPRPPTVQKTVSFETANFHELKKISRRIQPRAPPSISL